MTYYIKHTNKSLPQNRPDIHIQENSLNLDTDIVLFGRKKLEYGQDMNTNLLRLLENFACPEDPTNVNWPYTNLANSVSNTSKQALTTPVIGQLWFNKTRNCMNVFNGIRWVRIANDGDVSFNWGTLYDGENLPIPDSTTGEPFTWGDCTWITAITNMNVIPDKTECFVNEFMQLTAKYTIGSTTYSTSADFLVVAIRGNINMGNMNLPDGGEINAVDPDIFELNFEETPPLPDLYALNGYEDYEPPYEDDISLELDTINIESTTETEPYIEREALFFEEFKENYNFRYSTIGFEIIQEQEHYDVYAVFNKDKRLMGSSNKPYVMVTTDGITRDNVRLIDDTFDKWISTDENCSFTFGMKSRKIDNSMDYVNFIIYFSDDETLDESDRYGQISYRLERK